MATTKIPWPSLVKALNKAGVVIVGDHTAVYSSGPSHADPNQGTVGLYTWSRDGEQDELYCVLDSADNREVVVSDSSAFVTPVGSREAEEQISFYTTWDIAADEEIEKLERDED